VQIHIKQTKKVHSSTITESQQTLYDFKTSFSKIHYHLKFINRHRSTNLNQHKNKHYAEQTSTSTVPSPVY